MTLVDASSRWGFSGAEEALQMKPARTQNRMPPVLRYLVALVLCVVVVLCWVLIDLNWSSEGRQRPARSAGVPNPVEQDQEVAGDFPFPPVTKCQSGSDDISRLNMLTS